MREIALLLICSSLGIAQQYTKNGNLVLPKDYRQWVFLSSGLGMSYTEGAPNANPAFDNIFVNPAAYEGFLKTGTWPDKTIMVLEQRASESRVSINKEGRVQAGVRAIEVHVKDASKGGWAFYGFHSPEALRGAGDGGTLFPKTANCYSCHAQNGATDTTFVQFYPTLIETAKLKGTYKETGH